MSTTQDIQTSNRLNICRNKGLNMETMSVFLSVFQDGLSSRVIKKKKKKHALRGLF